jgi:hypothetical protein
MNSCGWEVVRVYQQIDLMLLLDSQGTLARLCRSAGNAVVMEIHEVVMEM